MMLGALPDILHKLTTGTRAWSYHILITRRGTSLGREESTQRRTVTLLKKCRKQDGLASTE